VKEYDDKRALIHIRIHVFIRSTDKQIQKCYRVEEIARYDVSRCMSAAQTSDVPSVNGTTS